MSSNYIYRGSDLILNIKLEDESGVPFRVADANVFKLRLFTTDQNNYIECTYSASEGYKNIIAAERIDKVVANSTDLDKLKSGVIRFAYDISFDNALFNDQKYSEVNIVTTQFYLK